MDRPVESADDRGTVLTGTSVEGPTRVMVTGAAGFIGSHLVDALLERGAHVLAVDRRPPGDVTAAVNLAQSIDHPCLRVVTADLLTADLDELVSGVDTVFHLAAVPGVRTSWGPQFTDYINSNIVATQRLLAASGTAGIRRIVMASSSSVYGETPGPSREHDPTGPISPYGVTKLAAEQLCLAYAARPDVPFSVVALRYFTVYGPRQRPGMAISQVLLSALNESPVPLYGDGHQRREFTYVSDIVAATLAAATADVRAAVINVGGGASVTMLEILGLARDVTGNPVPIIHCAEQAGDIPATEADLTLARRILGYHPSVDLRDGMALHAAWLASLPDEQRRSRLLGPLEATR
ncbi:NAD-dependent epimerase/dehydratase family protein [Amycolatopsis sp. cmx-11-12]|uniref:NAD-dependent epimerase/dehydratase family protein n=1 Tax=Amycolatopsis sp. cmx-11-12 TaxID=2785795 RepID=UPI0039180687